MVSAFHKEVGIFCNSSRNEIMTVSEKIVVYFQSLPGVAIVRRWLKVKTCIKSYEPMDKKQKNDCTEQSLHQSLHQNRAITRNYLSQK